MIRALPAALLAGLVAAASPSVAELILPAGAVLAVSTRMDPSSHRVATGPYDGALPVFVAEGAVTRSVWRVPGAETSLALLAPLREQLRDDGWEVTFECATRDCGGFDFRFEIDVTPAPDMFVDLADYRYLAARRGEAWTTLLASLSGSVGYVQRIEVDPDGGAPDEGVTPVGRVAAVDAAPVGTEGIAPPTDLAAALRATGHAVLSDLDFATGSSDLIAPDYAALAALAAYMDADPSVTVALVGHTDATGGAAGNLAISRRRAESARRVLTGRYGVAVSRVDVQGVGFYAPIAGNDTEAGRTANRRVEVVVTSTD